MSKITLSFEEAMLELTQIVKRLEEGKIPLEEAVTVYERSTALRLHCEKQLKEATLKVEAIVQKSSGDVALESFELPA